MLEIAQSIITEFVKIHPTLADNGWGGYSFFDFQRGLVSIRRGPEEDFLRLALPEAQVYHEQI